MEVVKTLKLRVKDKHAKTLLAMARDANTVWNFVNETQYRSLKHYCNRPKVWLSPYDLHKLTSGFVKCDGVTAGSSTVESVCEEFVRKLKASKKPKLNWRVSDRNSPRYSLGWVPFKAQAIKYRNGQLRFHGMDIGIWDSYGLSKYELRAGSFNEDSRGRWYVNIAVKVPVEEKRVPDGATSIGIDLGLKTMATYSDGTVFDMPQWYRQSQEKLAVAQRANKKRQVKAIHAKIANQRKDAIHKETSSLVNKHAAIFVGNVNASALAKTNMAKSVNDAAWSMFRTQLMHKALRQCVVFEEVNEAFSTQACSDCGLIGGPKGLKGLSIRQWTCECGAIHDRDVNAARNIAARGLASLEEGVHS
jgi:putative transposase